MLLKFLILYLLAPFVFAENNYYDLLETVYRSVEAVTYADPNPCQCSISTERPDNPNQFEFSNKVEKAYSTKNTVSNLILGILNDLKYAGNLTIDQIGNETGPLYLSNVFVTGLDTIDPHTPSGSGLFGLTLNVSLGNLEITGNHRIDDLDLGIIQLWGEGDFQVVLQNFIFRIDFNAPKLSTGLAVTVKSFGVSLGSSFVHLGGILDKGPAAALLNQLVNSLVPYVVEAIDLDVGGHLTAGDTCVPLLEIGIDMQCALSSIVKNIMCTVVASLIPSLKC